jgi:hypothetical protein
MCSSEATLMQCHAGVGCCKTLCSSVMVNDHALAILDVQEIQMMRKHVSVSGLYAATGLLELCRKSQQQAVAKAVQGLVTEDHACTLMPGR